jgi:hypothetical protein
VTNKRKTQRAPIFSFRVFSYIADITIIEREHCVFETTKHNQTIHSVWWFVRSDSRGTTDSEKQRTSTFSAKSVDCVEISAKETIVVIRA